MKRWTIKIAGFTTIIYALLIFISMLIDDVYYSQFNIWIISYMSVSEILLSCIKELPKYITPFLYIAVAIIFYYTCIIFFYYKRLFYYEHFRQRWLLFWILSPKSLTTQFRIAARYNLLAMFILPITLFATSNSIYYYSSDMSIHSLMTWIFFPFVIELFLLALYIKVLPSPFYKLNVKGIYYTAREYWSIHSRLGNNIASPQFTHREQKLIHYNYKYRIVFLCLLFIAGWFIGQLYVNNRLAKEVKKNGTGVCAVMEGDNIRIDTRVDSLNYIGECANYIFIYDKNTQGTLIYNRKDIHQYLLIYDYIAQVHSKYEQHIEYSQDNKTHVLQSVFQQIESLPPCHNNFSIKIPSTYQLIKQSNNHCIWEDTITKTCIEQVNLPKIMFKKMPYDNDIFDISIYVRDETKRQNIGLCASIKSTFRGKGGELVKTFVGDGENYTAWIFYDSTGQNELLGEKIMDTISLSGNVWEQINSIYHANKKGWNIALIVLCIYYMVLLIIIVSLNDYDIKSSFWNNIKENHLWIFASFMPLISSYTLVLGSSHRWLVIFIALILYTLISLGVISIGIFICYIKETINNSIQQKKTKIIL